MSSRINLPNYFRTLDVRYLKALIHLKEGERACHSVLYPGKIEYCPVQGRDRKGEPPSKFERVNLLLDADPGAWILDSLGCNGEPPSRESYGGIRTTCLVSGRIKGINFRIPIIIHITKARTLSRAESKSTSPNTPVFTFAIFRP